MSLRRLGATLVVLTLALHERLNGRSSALARTATAFGIIWAVLVIASGMIYNVGMETVAGLQANNPEQAATVWLAIESVFTGLGGGVEVVGGIWVILLSVAGLRSRNFGRALHYLGYVVGAAGVISVIPAIARNQRQHLWADPDCLVCLVGCGDAAPAENGGAERDSTCIKRPETWPVLKTGQVFQYPVPYFRAYTLIPGT
ncbi:MAG: DUF4386 family protein [Chloroflexi bacterium]|nr:DUF4386 family protein [Chloroflexota bacterium]